MAFTTADRDAVKAAMVGLASGREQQVRFADGSQVTYMPMDMGQLEKLLDRINLDVAATAALTPGSVAPIRAVRLATRSGYC